MRPTWKAATIVDPFEKVSGSTSAWWLVVVDALQVAWVNGSDATLIVAADATCVGTPTAATAAAAATARAAQREELRDPVCVDMTCPHSCARPESCAPFTTTPEGGPWSTSSPGQARLVEGIT